MINQLTRDEFKTQGKYNTTVKLTEADQKAKVKIYCHEDYAQELYDIMSAYDNGIDVSNYSKDLQNGQVCKVKAELISFKDKLIHAKDIDTGISVTIPFREYSAELEDLQRGENTEFYVVIYKASKFGEYSGSERKARSITYKQELFNHLSDNTWFDVTITKLIKGGYLAIYKKEIECFIPGSHAAANIVHNFNDMLGKTLTVMVDNYDQSNDLFILSYKKYVAESMSTMIGDLSFSKKYVGVLTNKPYDFGTFVEIDGYYTGLIHHSEFDNYETVRKTMKTGDTIEVYVKDITNKRSKSGEEQYRIVLTLSEANINPEKSQWEKLREQTENKCFPYDVNTSNNSISIEVNGEKFEVSLRRKELEKNLSTYPFVKVFKVDPIHKNLRFEFVETNN